MAFALFIALDYFFPLPIEQTRNKQQQSAIVVASDGEPLRAFASDKGVWRYPINIDDVSPLYFETLLSYEDRWFYQHPGINPYALLRAMWQRISNGKVISGGSTLTMQVARIIDPHSRSISGKIKQMFRATQLEWHYSKKEILTFYINLAPFGGAIEGVEAASRAYLGKSAKELTRAEAALLTVLPQAPTRFRPDRQSARAENARNKVINRMVSFKIWTPEQAKQAKIEKVMRRHYRQPMLAPLFARRMKKRARKTGIVKTTLDSSLQITLEDKIKDYVTRFPARTSAAVLVVDNKSLEVRAYVGSADFVNNARFGHIDMVQASRSPGSTLKPFLYGLAIEDGLLHSASLLSDAPIEYDGYRPSNFSRGFRGPVSMSQALQLSLNLPAVQTMYHYTPQKFMARVRNGGLKLTIPNHGKPNLAVILGGTGTSLESLVSAYTAFGRQGLSGRLRFQPSDPLVERRMLDSGAAWIIRNILEANSRPGVPQDYLSWSNSRLVAWKTGTSYGFRDAWAIGVTDQYTIGVWVGRPDSTPVPGHYGAVTAAPILFDIVDSLPTRDLIANNNARPSKVKRVKICWPLGSQYNEKNKDLCHERRSAWILSNTIPGTLPDIGVKAWESRIVKYWVNAATNKLVTAECGVAKRVPRTLARWPYALEPWLPPSTLAVSKLPKTDKGCPQHSVNMLGHLKITGLAAQTVVRKSGPNADHPLIHLAALGGKGRLFWLINGNLKARTKPSQHFNYQFKKPGLYKITVMDNKGQYDSVEIKVIQ